MSITIIKAGLFTTVQDVGRKGFQHLGINPNGAMDALAMQIANVLIQNKSDEAVIEFFYPAPVIRFNASGFIALSGADFGATINEIPIPINHPIFVPENAVLSFTKKISGHIAYLAIQGGLELNEWMNSYSTNTRAGAGGVEGRVLIKDDEIHFKATALQENKQSQLQVLPWMADTKGLYQSQSLRYLPGNEFSQLNTFSQQFMTNAQFTILADSDRMGYRLKGPVLKCKKQMELISSGVTNGTIQLLPNGQCIVLLADHQTSGGYPRIGHIIQSDIPTLVQQSPGSIIRLIPVNMETAEKINNRQAQYLQQLKNACTLQLNAYHRH
ncbi:biotin-dependent carboxyltransferase family protein [Sediminibacterium sp.]|uniref:5-oxoprolinase subunit C family protein n=1 Tax=Sediminibacterium sp. TaxID=1917865 RepID=UPI0027364081|nr:biotin-dependent carboxyltransferase family protein [Sediminibacterium sp.]MDP3394445.1 biotin-dependent carboxyltransferase family protein [Sediminibacterium sp.]MDP3568280.1 biotin-dependent carboxyltransferase family protein [Sediminibacterium sp.]